MIGDAMTYKSLQPGYRRRLKDEKKMKARQSSEAAEREAEQIEDPEPFEDDIH